LEASFVNVTKPDALEYIRTFEIDRSFNDFLSFCRQNKIEVTILSDGLDFYIEELLARNGITGVPSYSNHINFDHGKIEVEFPFESDCEKCGNCKGAHILTKSGADDLIVHVGNGYSDRCGVQYADVVFAKDDLLKYCEENNVTYFRFNDFSDVLTKFRKIVEAGHYRKRHRAELRRREAYLGE